MCFKSLTSGIKRGSVQPLSVGAKDYPWYSTGAVGGASYTMIDERVYILHRERTS